MANGAKVAMAVGAGYFLGRTRKMRLALMLAGAGLTGKIPSNPSELAAQGLKSLGASADVTQLTEQLRGELLGAARAAALATATNRVNALNDRLTNVTSAVDADKVVGDVGGTVAETGGRLKPMAGLRRRRRAEPDTVEDDGVIDDTEFEDGADEDAYEDAIDDDTDNDDIDDESLDIDEDADEDELDLEDEPEEEPAPEPPKRRRRVARQSPAKTAMRRSARANADDGQAASVARHGRSATKRAPVRRGR